MPDTLRLVPRHGDHIDRRDLTDAVEIVERMARDIVVARRDGGGFFVDLPAAGWTQAQATRWGPVAHDLAASPGFLAQLEVERLRAFEPPAPAPRAEMAAIAEATIAADARPGAVERVMHVLSSRDVVSALFGLSFYGALTIGVVWGGR
jgi:hypothetical protein